MSVYAKIATRIRKIRHEKGWSQEDLAHFCGVHRTYISHIENGKREISVETLCKLAKGCGITASELIDGIEL